MNPVFLRSLSERESLDDLDRMGYYPHTKEDLWEGLVMATFSQLIDFLGPSEDGSLLTSLLSGGFDGQARFVKGALRIELVSWGRFELNPPEYLSYSLAVLQRDLKTLVENTVKPYGLAGKTVYERGPNSALQRGSYSIVVWLLGKNLCASETITICADPGSDFYSDLGFCRELLTPKPDPIEAFFPFFMDL